MKDGGASNRSAADSGAAGAGGAQQAGASAGDPPKAGTSGTGSTDAGTNPDAGAGLAWELSGNWSEPALFEEGSADVFGITVAQNRAGDTVVGWLQDMPESFYCMRRFVQGTWEPMPFRASKAASPPSGYGGYFGVDINPHGVAQLFYRGVDASMPMNLKTYWSEWQGQTVALQDAAPLIFGGANTVGIPAYSTITDSGRSIAVWSQSGSGSVSQTVYSNVRSEAGQWATPQRLGDLDAYFLAAGMAANQAGQFLVAAVTAPIVHVGQNDDRPGKNTMRTFLVDGASVRDLPPLAMPQEISGNRVLVQLDAAGNGMLLFRGPASQYWARYRAATNAWTAFEKLTDKLVLGARLMLTPSGELLALAQEYTPPPDFVSNPETTRLGFVTARRYSDSTGWSAPETLSDTDYFDVGFDAAMAPSGDLIVVWQQKRVGSGIADGAVLSRRFVQNKWSATEVVRRYVAFGGVAFGGDVDIQGVTLAENGRALLIMTNHGTPNHTFRPNDLEWMQSK